MSQNSVQYHIQRILNTEVIPLLMVKPSFLLTIGRAIGSHLFIERLGKAQTKNWGEEPQQESYRIQT